MQGNLLTESADPRAGSGGEDARHGALDALRGVAVLGILLMNIVSFALPMAAYMNPMSTGLTPYAGDYHGVNGVVWAVAHVIADQKFMSIFSMLFGAGIVLLAGKVERGARGSPAAVHYRRIAWLLLFGMIHAYALWYGDILVLYAMCGAVVYLVRRWRPRWLLVAGAALTLVAVPISAGYGGMLWLVREEARAHAATLSEGRESPPERAEMAAAWQEITSEFDPTPEQVEEQIAAGRGGYVEYVTANASAAWMVQTVVAVIWGLWRAGGLMLIGMALFKLGVLTGERSARLYVWMAAIGYGVGLPLVLVGAWMQHASGFDVVRWFILDGQFNYVGSVGVALGHVALVMLATRSGRFRAALSRLASVGRMAFTNYISQTLLCTLLFAGWGLGLYGRLERWQLLGVVGGVWALQLAWSPWWLARFRFGPLEWLWRSLTYLRLQPLRRSSARAQ